MMAYLTGARGLILLDPLDPDLKKLAALFIQKPRGARLNSQKRLWIAVVNWKQPDITRKSRRRKTRFRFSCTMNTARARR